MGSHCIVGRGPGLTGSNCSTLDNWRIDENLFTRIRKITILVDVHPAIEAARQCSVHPL